jgi:hypothetical protein
LAHEGKDPDFFAIRLKTNENISNLSPDFWERLKHLPEHLYKRFVEADDAPFEGLVFPMFDRKLHILDQKNFCPPSHWPVFVGMDYGMRSNTHCTWITFTEQGHAVCFKEYVMNGVAPRTHADNIRAINSQFMSRGMSYPKLIVIDPATQQSKGEAEISVFKQLVESGLTNLTPGRRETNDLAGVSLLSQLLQPQEAIPHPISDRTRSGGWPQLYFTLDCPVVTSEFDEWTWKGHKDQNKDAPEKPEERNDHGIDSVRYALSLGMQTAGIHPLTQTLYENSPAYHNQKLIEKDLKDFKRQEGGWNAQFRHSGVT